MFYGKREADSMTQLIAMVYAHKGLKDNYLKRFESDAEFTEEKKDPMTFKVI